MDVVQLHISFLSIKLLGYFLCVFFALKAFNRLNSLNIDIGGKLIRINVFYFLLPLGILLISPIFDLLYEVYGMESYRNISMTIEGISGVIFAFAFLNLFKKLQGE